MRWVQQDSNEAYVANLCLWCMAAPSLRVVLLFDVTGHPTDRGRCAGTRTLVCYPPFFHFSTDGTTAGVLSVSWLRLPPESVNVNSLPRSRMYLPRHSQPERGFGVHHTTKTLITRKPKRSSSFLSHNLSRKWNTAAAQGACPSPVATVTTVTTHTDE